MGSNVFVCRALVHIGLGQGLRGWVVITLLKSEPMSVVESWGPHEGAHVSMWANFGLKTGNIDAVCVGILKR